MSQGQTLYMAMVLVGFFMFIGVVGFLSIWSRKPASQADRAGHASPAPTSKAASLQTARAA